MYLWSSNKLAEDFRNNIVTERQQLSYLLLYIIFTYLSSDPYILSFFESTQPNNFDIALLPTNLAIVVAGTIACYSLASNKKTPVGFIPRYMCLGIPILVRLTVLAVLLLTILFVVYEFSIASPSLDEYIESDQTTLPGFIAVCFFEALYFWMLYQAIRTSYLPMINK